MPVRPNNFVPWPNRIIPYENDAAARSVQTAIDQFNQHLGFNLFVPRNGQAHYAVFKVGETGHSAIGYQARAAQSISVRGAHDTWTTLHEMGHCVGLGHEHFHSAFPINNTAIRDRWIALFVSSRPALRADFVRDVNYAREVQQRSSYVDVGGLDTDSIMMYGDWRDAYLTANHLAITPRAAQLTAADIAAIRTLYPPPAPPPMRDFTLTIHGSWEGDSVQMKFEVRSASHPARSSRGQTDVSGRAVIRGYRPDDTEIRIPDLSVGWSRIRIGDNMAAPGGRYTFVCR